MDGSTVIDRELELVEILEDEHPPACEGSDHATEEWGHVLSQSASYIVRMPCGNTYLCCAGRVARYADPDNGYVTVRCPSSCKDRSHRVCDLTWTELV